MTTQERQERDIVRRLAEKYAEVASDPAQETKRNLWRDHYSLRRTRPMVLCLWVCCLREVIEPLLVCRDPFLRQLEKWFRTQVIQHETGDDLVLEPWLTQPAVVAPGDGFSDGKCWGFRAEHTPSAEPGGAWKNIPAIAELADARRLVKPQHVIDEAETRRRVEQLSGVIGDRLPINVRRAPGVHNFSNALGRLRGIEHLMLDMYDNPRWLHEILAFMRDGILEIHRTATAAGHWRAADHTPYVMGYADGLARPTANSPPVSPQELFYWFDAQEYAQVSPAMHDEFMLQYQIPIMEQFGLTHYGCCEDLTRKIPILRQVRNLRRIAVSPWSDIRKCAEQIGGDYIFSWHPNPTDMGCCGFDPVKIRRIVRETMAITNANGCHVDIVWKDVNTLEGHPERLRQWTQIVREESEKFA